MGRSVEYIGTVIREPVATRPLFMQQRNPIGDPSTYFFAHDGNKNVSDVISYSSAGGVVAHYDYAPFGAVTSETGPLAATNPFRFSSEYHDDSLGLVYYNYRHYNPQDGRCVSKDLIESEIQIYGFCYNAPVQYLDFLGMLPNNQSQETPLEIDRNTLEEKLKLTCPDSGESIRTSWNSCCNHDSCVEQAKQVANAVFDVVNKMSTDVIIGGWCGNLSAALGYGYKCYQWQWAVVDAVENLNFGDSACFKGIGVADYIPFTSVVKHQWTNVYGSNANYLTNNNLNNLPHVTS